MAVVDIQRDVDGSGFVYLADMVRGAVYRLGVAALEAASAGIVAAGPTSGPAPLRLTLDADIGLNSVRGLQLPSPALALRWRAYRLQQPQPQADPNQSASTYGPDLVPPASAALPQLRMLCRKI